MDITILVVRVGWEILEKDARGWCAGNNIKLTQRVKNSLKYQSAEYTELWGAQRLAVRPPQIFPSASFPLAGFNLQCGGIFPPFSFITSKLVAAYKVPDQEATVGRIVNLKDIMLDAARASCPTTDFHRYR